MAQVLYIRFASGSYMLYSRNHRTWRLFYMVDRLRLNIHSTHTLDFWRGKGEIQGEEEKNVKGS